MEADSERFRVQLAEIFSEIEGVNRQPHFVPNCKVFSGDGRGGWDVAVRDETVEWETGDEVFRHQLNFQQMEALYEEARQAGVSVRDTVHEVMKRLARSQPVHVRTVHDAVFLWMRTCSLFKMKTIVIALAWSVWVAFQSHAASGGWVSPC